MKLTISTVSGAPPIYKQLYEQVSAQILSGELEGDSALPPIRTVAKELRVSVIPVKQAWEELERAGLIYTMVGRGCFVAPLHSEELDTRRESMAFDKLMQEIQYYKQLGLTKEQLLEMVERCYE
ncbi:MAG: GntR family transcriptional regulator [Ruminococcaceae bacterium]|nr:GntR family transcriptional regulator [Oscillospiraceae bacterium]